MSDDAKPPLADRLYSLSEAAERLSLSLRTLQYLIRDGAIRSLRISRRRVAIHPDDLAAYVASRRVQGRA